MKKKKPINTFVEKSTLHGMFQFDHNGVLHIAGITAFMLPMSSIVIQHHLMSTYLHKKKFVDIVYYSGKIQGAISVKLLREKFGVKLTTQKLFMILIDQGKMGGYGKLHLVRFNEKDKHVIVRKPVSPYEETYTKIFGYQNQAVGHFDRGAVAGMLEELFGEEMIAIERQCKAKRQDSCVNDIFPRRLLKEKKLTAEEKKQVPKPESDFPEVKKLRKVLFYL